MRSRFAVPGPEAMRWPEPILEAAREHPDAFRALLGEMQAAGYFGLPSYPRTRR